MKKNYILLALLLVSLLPLKLAAQEKLLNFKQLNDELYYNSLEEALKSPNQVYKLTLDAAQLKKLPAELQKLPNLQLLNLKGSTKNMNWAEVAAQLSKMKKVQYLFFQEGDLTTVPTPLCSLTQLKGLSFVYCPVAVITPEIGKLTNLEYFMVVSGRVASLPVEMGKLTNMRVLVLDGNNISVIPVQMANLKKLEELMIAGNNLNKEELKKLRKYYPKAKISDSYEVPEN